MKVNAMFNEHPEHLDPTYRYVTRLNLTSAIHQSGCKTEYRVLSDGSNALCLILPINERIPQISGLVAPISNIPAEVHAYLEACMLRTILDNSDVRRAISHAYLDTLDAIALNTTVQALDHARRPSSTAPVAVSPSDHLGSCH